MVYLSGTQVVSLDFTCPKGLNNISIYESSPDFIINIERKSFQKTPASVFVP